MYKVGHFYVNRCFIAYVRILYWYIVFLKFGLVLDSLYEIKV